MPLNINLLPPEYRRPFLSLQGWLFLFIASFLLISLFPLLMLRMEVAEDIDKLERELKLLIQEEKKLAKLEPKVKELSEAIGRAWKEWEGMNQDYELITRMKWSGVLKAVKDYLPEEISLTSLTQKERFLVVKGETSSLSHLVPYLSSLEATRLFSEILLSYEHHKGILIFTLSLEIKR